MVPLVFLHGFTGSSKSWNELRNKLNFSSKAIDCPGHGNNLIKDLSNPCTFEDWQKEFNLNLHLNNLEKINLCGYSMGGRLAISFASAFPKKIKSLILISSTAGFSNEVEQKNRIQKDTKLCNKIINDFQLFLNEWEKLDFFSQQQVRNPQAFKIQRAIREHQNPQQMAYILENLGTGKMPNYWEKISEFDFPVLIICGDEDEKYCEISKKLNNNIPNSQLKIIHNSGHAPHIDQPDEVARVIQNFIKS